MASLTTCATHFHRAKSTVSAMATEVTRVAEMEEVTKRIFGDTGIHVRYTPCTS